MYFIDRLKPFHRLAINNYIERVELELNELNIFHTWLIDKSVIVLANITEWLTQ